MGDTRIDDIRKKVEAPIWIYFDSCGGVEPKHGECEKLHEEWPRSGTQHTPQIMHYCACECHSRADIEYLLSKLDAAETAGLKHSGASRG